jgi:hypothetical protein
VARATAHDHVDGVGELGERLLAARGAECASGRAGTRHPRGRHRGVEDAATCVTSAERMIMPITDKIAMRGRLIDAGR